MDSYLRIEYNFIAMMNITILTTKERDASINVTNRIEAEAYIPRIFQFLYKIQGRCMYACRMMLFLSHGTQQEITSTTSPRNCYVTTSVATYGYYINSK